MAAFAKYKHDDILSTKNYYMIWRLHCIYQKYICPNCLLVNFKTKGAINSKCSKALKDLILTLMRKKGTGRREKYFIFSFNRVSLRFHCTLSLKFQKKNNIFGFSIIKKVTSSSWSTFANVNSHLRLQTGLILNPEHGPSPTFIFETRFRNESQIYRVSQDMRNCWVSKNVVYGCSCRYTVSSHSK